MDDSGSVVLLSVDTVSVETEVGVGVDGVGVEGEGGVVTVGVSVDDSGVVTVYVWASSLKNLDLKLKLENRP